MTSRSSIFALLLSCLFLFSCKPESQNFGNGSFTEWTEENRPKNWSTSLLSRIEKVSSGGDTLIKIYANSLLPSTIEQTFSVEKDQYYIVSADFIEYECDKWILGMEVIGTDKLGFHILESKEYNSSKTLFIKFQADSDQALIRIGFIKRGKGHLLVDNVSIRDSNEQFGNGETIVARRLIAQLGIDSLNKKNIHQSVIKVARFVNESLIQPLNQFYSFKGSNSEKLEFILQQKSKRDSLKVYFDNNLSYSFFNDNLGLEIDAMDAYCVKASLSSHDLLNEFNIPTRQIHFINNKGEGIHQCFEYWNQYEERWIAVDPYYGFTYTDRDRLIGFEEIEMLASEGRLTESNLKKEDLLPFYYNYDELRQGWFEIKSSRKGSYRKTYPF